MLKLKKQIKNKFLIPAAIVLLAIFGANLLANLKQTPNKNLTPEPIKTPVTIKRLQKTHAMIALEGYGNLHAKDEVNITPEVSGKIIETHPQLAAGLKVKAQDMIFQIEPDEYEYRLEIEKANLARTEFELKEEQGRGLVAQREWSLLDKHLHSTGISKELALRQAHQTQKEAANRGAQGALALAKLNVKRTRALAPCDGVILSESISEGQWVPQGGELARIACTQNLKLIISMPPSSLRWAPSFYHAKAKAVANGHPATFIRLLSDVDERTKMIRLLFEMPGDYLTTNNLTTNNLTTNNLTTNHLNANTRNEDAKPLILGQFTKLVFSIPSPMKVFSIEQSNIRQDNQIWISEENLLRIRSIDTLYRTGNKVIVQLKEPTEILNLITSYINTPYEGMPLQVLGENTQTNLIPEPN